MQLTDVKKSPYNFDFNAPVNGNSETKTNIFSSNQRYPSVHAFNLPNLQNIKQDYDVLSASVLSPNGTRKNYQMHQPTMPNQNSSVFITLTSIDLESQIPDSFRQSLPNEQLESDRKK